MSEASVIQFLMVDQFEVQSLRQVVPDVPHLGGTHEPGLTNMHGKADEVLRTSGQKALADGQPDHQPKPSPSEDVNVEERHLDEPENAHYVEDARPYDFAFMSFVSDGTFHGTPYDSDRLHVIQDVDMVSNTIIHPDKLAFPAHMMQYVVLAGMYGDRRFRRDQHAVFAFASVAATTAVIERVNNIL